jgi:hypothetical protein
MKRKNKQINRFLNNKKLKIENGFIVDIDSLQNIFSFLDNIVDFKSLRLVCKSWKYISERSDYWKNLNNELNIRYKKLL